MSLQSNGKAETLEAVQAVGMQLLAAKRSRKEAPSVLSLLEQAWAARGGQVMATRCKSALEALCTLLGGRKGLSSFEVTTSGILSTLLAYLTAAELGPSGIASPQVKTELAEGVAKVLQTPQGQELVDLQVRGPAAPVRRPKRAPGGTWQLTVGYGSRLQMRLLRRERARLWSCLQSCSNREGRPGASPRLSWSSSSSGPTGSSGGTGETALQQLVWQLQSCLAASERFPLVLSGGKQLGRGSVVQLLSQPLKLKIRCSTAEKDPELQAYLQARGLANFSILIEPMAAVRAIRGFMERRLAAKAGPDSAGDLGQRGRVRRELRHHVAAVAMGNAEEGAEETGPPAGAGGLGYRGRKARERFPGGSQGMEEREYEEDYDDYDGEEDDEDGLRVGFGRGDGRKLLDEEVEEDDEDEEDDMEEDCEEEEDEEGEEEEDAAGLSMNQAGSADGRGGTCVGLERDLL